MFIWGHELHVYYLQGQFAPVKGNYSQEFKDLIMKMLNQDPAERPSAHQLMYIDLPTVCYSYTIFAFILSHVMRKKFFFAYAKTKA